MKCAKKTLALLLAMVVLTGVLSSIPAVAKETSIYKLKIKVKTIKDSTGVKITIGKTKDADGYDLEITGTPANSEYCKYFKIKESDDNVYMTDYYFTKIEKNGESKRSITYKNLQPGTYTVKVCSWKKKKDGTKVYNSDWSEKKFTLKEAATNGFDTSYDFSKVKKGDVIKFGSYEQDLDYTNGKEPIEWIVLKKTKNSVLLLSKYALEKLPYNNKSSYLTWETCSLRKWLNNDFIKSSFNETEQGMIRKTTVKNYDNSVYKTAGGNDTEDKVFLLSEFDMVNGDFGFSEAYNTDDIDRRCAFAWDKNKNGIGGVKTKDGAYTCWWWLRSPGQYASKACFVYIEGSLGLFGEKVTSVLDTGYGGNAGVRPAMYLNLKS